MPCWVAPVPVPGGQEVQGANKEVPEAYEVRGASEGGVVDLVGHWASAVGAEAV